jgi:hypothetical protein
VGTSQTSWFLFGVGSAVALLALVGACSSSTNTSEIDAYDADVQSSTAEGALAFIKTYRTSHLVSDLVESLPPNVAAQVCSDMPGGVSSSVARSCQHMQEMLAAIPPAAPAPVVAAAVPAMNAGTSGSVSGCGGVIPSVAPPARDATASVEATHRRQLLASKMPLAADMSPVQVAEVYASASPIDSRLAIGRGGNGGDGGGASHR